MDNLWIIMMISMDNLLYNDLVGGFNPSEQYRVNWDDEIPKIWKNKIRVPKHQAVIYLCLIH